MVNLTQYEHASNICLQDSVCKDTSGIGVFSADCGAGLKYRDYLAR